jgi:hypothetical protein
MGGSWLLCSMSGSPLWRVQITAAALDKFGVEFRTCVFLWSSVRAKIVMRRVQRGIMPAAEPSCWVTRRPMIERVLDPLIRGPTVRQLGGYDVAKKWQLEFCPPGEPVFYSRRKANALCNSRGTERPCWHLPAHRDMEVRIAVRRQDRVKTAQ